MRIVCVMLLCTLYGAAGADFTIGHLEAVPEQGEGIYQVLRRYGLKANRQAYKTFVSLNARKIGNSDALFPKKSYRLPVIVLSLEESFENFCSKLGVGKWYDEIIAYNNLYNEMFHSSPEENIGTGQLVYIPEINSGFYEKGSGLKPSSIPIHNEYISGEERNYVRDLTMPYPKIKSQIELSGLGIELEKYCFIIDPGHGGKDPGTNPVVMQGDGLEVQTFEAALVYDVAMRLLKHIRLHGGEVFLTHYSPLYGIRDNKNPQEYRHHSYNLSPRIFTSNTSGQSIIERKEIVRTIISRGYNKGKKTIFISVHADYRDDETLDLPITVYYHRFYSLVGDRSKQFALRLSEELTGSVENAKNLGIGILYQNPADMEILLELVNLNNKSGAWRLRDHTYRERLAWILTNGLIHTLE